MSFTDILARDTASLRAQIHTMPFNRQLAAGTLPAETFRGYIIQDARYLEGFARALSLAAAKADTAQAVAQLAGSAAGAIAVERQLHAHYMGLFDVTPAAFAAVPASAACDHYVSFLLRSTALGDFPEAVAALLPCFWIYRDIGREIAQQAEADNPYRAWIDTYSGEAFDESVAGMLALTDRLGGAADAATRARMQTAFGRAVWHEWRFWDSAHRREDWPQPDQPARPAWAAV